GGLSIRVRRSRPRYPLRRDERRLRAHAPHPVSFSRAAVPPPARGRGRRQGIATSERARAALLSKRRRTAPRPRLAPPRAAESMGCADGFRQQSGDALAQLAALV